MSVTINQIVQRVKAHPGVAGSSVTSVSDDNFAYAVAQQIPSALDELTNQCLADSEMRQYTFTNPATVTVNLDVNGKVDLQATILAHGILIEHLAIGELNHAEYDDPLTRLGHSGQGATPGNFDFMHGHYWLTGFILNTRGTDGPLTGPLGLAVPAALKLNTLNIQLADPLVDLIVRRLRGAPVPPPEAPKK